jgi:hypothetical protein
VEQKNGAVVREYIGYDRLEGEVLRDRLATVYRDLVPLLNFFSEVKAELSKLCGLYNPVRLQHNVNKTVLALREAVAAQSPSSRRESAA